MLTDNPREKRRSLFFLSGLVVSLGLIIVVMQSATVLEVETSEPPHEKVFEYSDDIPITKPVKEEKPAPKRLRKPEPDPAGTPEPAPKLNLGDITGADNDSIEAPVAIGSEPDLDDAEPVPQFLLENIAVPTDCGQLKTHAEKVTCMNSWIRSYLQKNLQYPEQASRLNLEGKVFVSFVVSAAGEITEVKIERGEYEILNREAQRAVTQMPDWLPGQQFTRKVPMRMVIPVQFSRR